MKRRQLIKGLAGAATVATVGNLSLLAARSQDERFHLARESNTFTEDDNLQQRLDKLNALMNTEYSLHVWMPDEWRVEQPTRGKPFPPVREAELLAATSKTLIPNPKEPYQWGVYLGRNGKQWSGRMSPVEYLHWTAEVGLGYRLARSERV